MRYRSFGKTGLRVSELSFGAMTFGRGLGSISKVDEPLAEEMIARAIDAGVNLFDTADVYSAGASEEMLGRALGKRRADVLVATKVGFPSGFGVNERGLSYRRVVSAAEASLRRLGSDWIDLYQIHKRDAYAPMEATARAFEDLRARGFVRYAGFSNLCAWEAALAIGMQRQHGWASNVSQLESNLQAADIDLTQEETVALDAATPAYKPYPASFRDTFPDDF